MELTINKAWFEKNKAGFLEAGDKEIKELGEGEQFYRIELDGLVFEDVEVGDEGNTLRLFGSLPPIEEDDIWINLDIPLSTNLQLELVQAVLKKMNKMKAVLEGLK